MPTVLNNIGISGDYGQIVFHNDGTDNIIDLSHSNATTVTHDLSINNTLQAGQILGTKSGKVIELSGNALMVPVGTDNQRPDNASGAVGVGEIGMIRYNTTSSTFEGYGPTAWGSLGGVINTQQKTFVEAIDEHSNHDISSNSIQFTTSGELVAVINADGRVGIGSTNPGHLLDVAGDVRFQDNLYLGEGTDNANWIQSHAILNLNSNDGETRFYTDGTQKMVLTASGGLGIGTTEPHGSYALDVSGNISVTGRIKSGATFTSDAPSTLFQGQNNTHLRAETGQILFIANGSERMRVNLDGHVGIGTNAPTTRLDISNNTANSVLAVRQHDPAQNIAEFYNGANQLMVIDNSGSLGINRSNVTTDYALDVSGAAIFSKSLYIRDDADPEGAQITMEAHNNTHQWHIDISAGDFRIFEGSTTHAIRVSDTTNFIGLNGAIPTVELDISGTGALRIPVGNNSGDRPEGANGMIRYNNTDNRYEGYSESSWGALGGGGGGSGQVVTNIRTLTQGETLLNIDISANTSAYMPHKVSMSDDGNRVAIADSTVDAGDTTESTVKIYDYNVNNNQYEVKETITVQRDDSITTDAEGIRGIHMTGDKNTILVVTANVTGADADASDYDGSYNFTPYELTSSDPVTYTPGTPLTVDNAPWYDMDDGTTLMIAKKDATGSNRDVYFYNYSGSNKEFTLNQTVSYATDISNALPAGFADNDTTPKHVAISGDGLRALWVEEDRSNIIVFKRLSTFADFQILQTIQLGSGSAAELLHPNFDYAGKFMAVSMPGTGNDNAIKIYAYDETKFNYVLESSFKAIATLTDNNSLGKQEAHVSKDGTRLFVGASGATNGAIAMLKLDKQGKVPVSSGTATAEHIIYGLSSGDKFGMGLSTDYNGKRMIGVGLESGSSVSNVRVIQTQEDSITSSSTFNINEVKSVGGPLLLTPDPAHPRVGINTSPSSSFHLDISGNINISGTINQAGSPYIGSQWTTVNTDEIHYSTGNVGIGTNDPKFKLDIGAGDVRIANSTGSSGNDVELRLTTYNESGDARILLSNAGYYNGVASRAHKVGIISEADGGWGRGQLHFCINNSSGVGTDSDSDNASISHAKMTITRDGNVGIGITNPNYGLERRGGSTDNQAFHGDLYIGKEQGYGWKITTVTNNGGGGVYQYWGSERIYFNNLNKGQYTVYAAAGHLQGNNGNNVGAIDFTGQHRCFVDNIKHNEAVNYRGLIVCADKNDYISIESKPERGNKGISISESLPLVSLSTKHKDKSCFGVISDSEDPDTRSHSNGSMLTTIFDKEIGDTRIYINSVGEGAIWIIDASGNLESGDYITTSIVPGYGVVQESEFLANYTVAKITMDCDFSPPLQSVKIIKKKNLLDSSGNQIYNGSGSITIEKNPDGFEVVTDLSAGTILARKEKDENIFYEQVDSYYTTDASGNKIKIYTVSGTTIIDNSDNIVYDYNGGETTLTNDLDSNGDFQWVDSTVQEYAYNIRYVDAAGTILTESDYTTKKADGEAVYKAAFVGCTYHCG